jgi:hypothetical protein
MKGRLIFEVLIDNNKMGERISFDIPKEQEYDPIQLIILSQIATMLRNNFAEYIEKSVKFGTVLPNILTEIFATTKNTATIIPLNNKKGKN